MIKQLGKMLRPEVDMDLCELCGENFKAIKATRERGDPDEYWEQTIIRYEDHWYLNGLAENARWLEYSVCPKCFFKKILPKLHEAGLPKKDLDGIIA